MAQRGNHLGTLDFEEIAARCDCATVDVPTSAVGFVMGSKGATLRELESRHNAFLVFDNDTVRDDAKRMYVLGGAENRDGTAQADGAADAVKAEAAADKARAAATYAAAARTAAVRLGAAERKLEEAEAGRPARTFL